MTTEPKMETTELIRELRSFYNIVQTKHQAKVCAKPPTAWKSLTSAWRS